jgi:hypothetical protein
VSYAPFTEDYPGGVYGVLALHEGADPASNLDNEACPTEAGVSYQPIGMPLPWVEVVGPRAAKDTNDSPANAVDLPHGVRLHNRLVPKDEDFIRYKRGNGQGGGMFDAEKADPACEVVVNVEYRPGLPAPTVTVFRNAEDVRANANKVVEGLPPVHFLPNPADVYFARIRAASFLETGMDTVVEIDSECTQSTLYPVLTGVPTFSSTTLTANGTIQVTLPVNAITASASVTLVATDGSGNRADWSAGGTVSNAPASVTFNLTARSDLTAGTYAAKVTLYDSQQNLFSEYSFDPSFSTTNYTVMQPVAGVTTEYRPSDYPLTFFTAP